MTPKGHHVTKKVISGPGWKHVELHSGEKDGVKMEELGPILAGILHKSMMNRMHSKGMGAMAQAHGAMHIQPHFVHFGPPPRSIMHQPPGLMYQRYPIGPH